MTTLLAEISGSITLPGWLVTAFLSAFAASLGFAVAWGMQRRSIQVLTEEVKALRGEIAELRKELHGVDKEVAVLEATTLKHPTGSHPTVSGVQHMARKT